MNHHETIALLAALKSAGVQHFRDGTTEITMAWSTSGPVAQMPPVPARDPAPPPAPVVDDAATEKLKDLIETLKMDDASLLDKIFPAGAGG